MNWKPKLPRVQWPDLILHIPSMVLYYGLWLVGLYVILSFGHGFVVQMFEYIPEAEMCFAIVAAIAVFVALLAILSEFIANKKDEAVKAKTAKLTGETYDEVNGTISQKFFWGYPLIATIAAVIIAAVVMFALNEVATTQYAEYVSTPGRVVMVGAVASFIAFAIMDKFLLRQVMNGLFYSKVEGPAIEKFLNGDVVSAVAEEVKSTLSERIAKYKAAGLSEDEIDEIIISTKK